MVHAIAVVYQLLHPVDGRRVGDDFPSAGKLDPSVVTLDPVAVETSHSWLTLINVLAFSSQYKDTWKQDEKS